MNSHDDAKYRLKLARDELNQAQKSFSDKSWWVCVNHAQLAVENGAKAIIACFEPVEKAHEVMPALKSLLEDSQVPDDAKKIIRDILPRVEPHGRIEHIRSTYGDEKTRTLPSKIYKKKDARQTLDDAEKTIRAARKVINQYLKKK